MVVAFRHRTVPSASAWPMRVLARAGVITLIAATAAAGGARVVAAQSTDASTDMSLDSLLAIPVHAAARYAQARSEAPAAVTVVTAEEIAAFGYRTLDEVLARAAGFYTTNDRNYTFIGVRGLSRPSDYNNRMLLLLNGHRLNEDVYGAAPTGNGLGFDLALIERVEIIRGPVSALYGTNAMLAVVNLITAQHVGTGGRVSAEAATAGHRVVSARAHTAVSSDVSFMAAAQYGRKSGTDLYYPEFDSGGSDGVARGLDWERFGSAFVSAHLGSLRIQARASTREKGVPTAAWGTTFGDPASRTVDIYSHVAGTWDRALRPSLMLSVNAAVDHFWYRGWYPYGDAGMSVDSTRAWRVSSGVQTVWDVSPRNRLVTGVSVSRAPRADYVTWSDGELDWNTNMPHTSVASYLQHELHVRRWLTLTGGARVDRRTGARTHVTPRASAIVRPHENTTLKLLYGTAFRSPNVYERTFTSDGDGVTTRLQPEVITTFEVVGEQRVSKTASMRLSLFTDQVDDLIDPVVDAEDESYSYFANAGNVRMRGLEGEFTIAVDAWLIQGGGILQSVVDIANGNRLTNAPRATFRVGANGDLFAGMKAAAQMRVEGGRLTLSGATTPAFTLVDMKLTYRAGSHAILSAAASNLFDRSYSYPASVEHAQDVIVQNGRSLSLRVEITP